MLIDSYINMFDKETLKARTGAEAVEVCRSNSDIDLILMDIRIPDMDGYEATQQIREFNKEVVIIAQTAYGLLGDREKSIESGCNDYIAKPINKTELLTLIIRAYATNSANTTVNMPAQNIALTANFQESDDPEPSTVTDIDGNVYQTVIIGNQEWMAENLRVTRNAFGNNIMRYCYGSNTANCDLYGGLYTWYTAMNGQSSSSSNPSGVQGICPTGWHVPSDAEWTELVNYVVSQGYPNNWDDPNGAGNALKSCRQVGSPLGGDCDTSEHPRWNSDDTHHGFDEFGFSALPGGLRNAYGSFSYLGTNGFWWSSTEYSSAGAWLRLVSLYGNVYRDFDNKSSGFSLRCVRDIE